MKVIIRSKKIVSYATEIEVSDYSDDSSYESQAEWLLYMKNNTRALIEICETEDGSGDIETTAFIEIVKETK